MAIIAYQEDGTVVTVFENILPYVDTDGVTRKGPAIYPEDELPEVKVEGVAIAGYVQWPDVLPFQPARVVVSRKKLRAIVSEDGTRVEKP